MMSSTMLDMMTGSPISVTALEAVPRRALAKVKAGLRGRPGWSAAQYTTVVQRLTEAPHGAAIADELYSELDPVKEAAEAAVQAMVKANMLAHRPASGRQCAA